MFLHALLSWSGQEVVNQSHSLIKWRYLEQRSRLTSICVTILKLLVSSISYVHTYVHMHAYMFEFSSYYFYCYQILLLSSPPTNKVLYTTLGEQVAVDCYDNLKQTIQEATFVAGDNATRSSAHEKRVLHSTSHWKIDRLSICKRTVECTMRYFTCNMHRISCCLVASDKSCLVYGLLKLLLCM